jgi:hypothetical protein
MKTPEVAKSTSRHTANPLFGFQRSHYFAAFLQQVAYALVHPPNTSPLISAGGYGGLSDIFNY